MRSKRAALRARRADGRARNRLDAARCTCQRIRAASGTVNVRNRSRAGDIARLRIEPERVEDVRHVEERFHILRRRAAFADFIGGMLSVRFNVSQFVLLPSPRCAGAGVFGALALLQTLVE